MAAGLTAAVQAKLDELERAANKAYDRLIGIDQKSSVGVEAIRDAATGSQPSTA